MEIPNWLRWTAVLGLVVWIFTDPRGLASVVTGIWTGAVTFFKALG